MKILLILGFILLTSSADALEGYYKYVGASYKSITNNIQRSGHMAQDITYAHITAEGIHTTSFRPTGKYYEFGTSKYYLMDDGQDVFLQIVDYKNDPCGDVKEKETPYVMRVKEDPNGFRILMTAVGLLRDNKTPYSFEVTMTLMDISKEEYDAAIEKTKTLQRACFDSDGNVERKL